MDDDQDSSFADLLARSAAPAPLASSIFAQDASEQDPWANPFAASAAAPDVSPYVTRLEDEGVISENAYTEYVAPEPEVAPEMSRASSYRIDPPSVIVQLEQQDDEEQAMLAALRVPAPAPSFAPAQVPASPPAAQSPYEPYAAPDPFSVPAQAAAPPTKAQPTDDLLGLDQYVDPSEALKKAFVKSSTPKPQTSAQASPQKKVVNRGKRGIVAGVPAKAMPKIQEVAKVPAKDEPAKDEKPQVKEAVKTERLAAAASQVNGEKATKIEAPAVGDAVLEEKASEGKLESDGTKDVAPVAAVDVEEPSAEQTIEPKQAEDSLHINTNPADHSLPASTQTTPTASHHPLPESRAETPTISRAESPVRPDRVITSPLETPGGSQTSFAALSIGASSSGKGWAAVDGDDDDGEEEGLFGKGFVPPALPSAGSSSASPWGSSAQTGWGDEEETMLAQPSRPVTPPTPAQREPTTPIRQESSSSSTTIPPQTPQTPSRQKPLFSISVGDPTKVGDPIRGHIVYTVRTRTTSPHFHKGEFSSLRRFSDFLWLFEALTSNNPGVIVPPVPDKHPFGRFQDQFVETRRLALERCLRKMCAHPVLQLDPDLKLFLESDSFAMDIKQRKLETPQEKQGYLASWTGPKYFEQDEWFDSRKIFLESLETQLKGLVKSIDTTSKQRLELALNVADFADGAGSLAESDLGSALSSALARLADLSKQEKEAHEEQAKADVVHIMSSADEYLRLIASVRLAFASRIKAWVAWQNAEKDVVRIRAARDKARQQGRSMAEGEGERRAREAAAEFEQVSRLVKSEFARFEKERVEEFKRMLERYLDGMVSRQKELIKAWEEYHGVILKMVQSSQAQRQAVVAA